MPKRLNPRENGMRRSARLRESQEKEELKNRKEHTTYGTKISTKLAFSVFSLFALSISVTMPKHRTNMNAKFTEQVVNRFHGIK